MLLATPPQLRLEHHVLLCLVRSDSGDHPEPSSASDTIPICSGANPSAQPSAGACSEPNPYTFCHSGSCATNC